MNMNQKKFLTKNIRLLIGFSILSVIMLIIGIIFLCGKVSISVDIRHRLSPVSSLYWFGTDQLGRDLLSCIIYGTVNSLLIGITVILFTTAAGSFIGIFSALAGGLCDTVIMRITDIVTAFPGLLLVIAVAAFSRPGIPGLIFLLSITGWVEFARLSRAETLKYKNREFILAARCYNASFGRILFHHMLPLVLPTMIVQASSGISGVIIAESTIHFLGLGGSPELPSLGQLIDSGRAYMFNHPLLIIIPGLILFLIVTAFQFIGDGLNRQLGRLRPH